jgi:hypothetical protein
LKGTCAGVLVVLVEGFLVVKGVGVSSVDPVAIGGEGTMVETCGGREWTTEAARGAPVPKIFCVTKGSDSVEAVAIETEGKTLESCGRERAGVIVASGSKPFIGIGGISTLISDKPDTAGETRGGAEVEEVEGLEHARG